MLHDSPVKQGFFYCILALSAFIVSAPLLWMVLSSFKGVEEIWWFPPTLWPHEPTFSGYRTIFQKWPFARYFANSVIVATLSTLLVLFTSSLAGYVFSKLRFRGKDIIFITVLASMMIPGQATLVPRYMIIRWLGWLDTYWALIIPQGIAPFGIFLVRQFLHSIPRDYIDAARIDGLSEFGVYSRIILPLAKPVLGALGIFAFLGTWNDLVWPLVVTRSPLMRTLPVGIASLATVHSPEMHLLMPAATISIVPILIAFALFQKQFVEGFIMSGLKG